MSEVLSIEPKPLLAVDLDGTVFKSSLLEKIIHASIDKGLFDAETFESAESSRIGWQKDNNEGTYDAYLDKLVHAFTVSMTGVDIEQFREPTKAMVAEQTIRRHRFPTDLIRETYGTHHRVIISGSPTPLVEAFVDDLAVDEIYGSTYEIENGRFTGRARGVGEKALILAGIFEANRALRLGSIAVGDTKSDKSMFHTVDHPVMFNPANYMRTYGAEYRWPRIIEIKDSITALVYNSTIGGYIEVPIDQFKDSILR